MSLDSLPQTKKRMIMPTRTLQVPGTPKNKEAGIGPVQRTLSSVSTTASSAQSATNLKVTIGRQPVKASITKTRQPSTSATPAPVRQRSARERRPTEKENYRRDEATDIALRHEDKDRRMQDKARKDLRTAYRENPEEFDEEPAELHSDIDLEEETMFVDQEVASRLSKKHLQFSSSKIPMAVKRVHPDRNEEQKSDSDDEQEYADPEQVNTSMTSGMRAKRIDIKRCRTSTSEPNEGQADMDKEEQNVARDTMVLDSRTKKTVTKVPKTKGSSLATDSRSSKAADSDAPRKGADYDPVTREVLNTASSLYRSMLCTKAPFPTSAVEESRLAQDAWKSVCKEKALQVQLTPGLMNLVLKRTSQVRGELKTKVRGLVGPFFGFRASDDRDIIRRNRDRAESLKEGSRFAYKDWENKKGIYKSDLIQLSINAMWFANRNDEGVIHVRYFNPIPIPTIALVLTAIECCIDEWASGVKADINFTAAAYGTVYQDHIKALFTFDEHTALYSLLDRIQQELHDTARCYSGAEPFKAETVNTRAVDAKAFQDAIEEYEMENGDPTDGGAVEHMAEGNNEGEGQGEGEMEGIEEGVENGEEAEGDDEINAEAVDDNENTL